VANSVTPSAKIATVGTRYNKRVVECRFALAAMAIKSGKIENFEDCEYKTFRQLQDDLSYSFTQMLELAEQSFSSKEPYTPNKIQREFQVENPFENVKDVPYINEVESKNKDFELYKRAFHVLSEAKRVVDFRETCNNAELNEDTKI